MVDAHISVCDYPTIRKPATYDIIVAAVGFAVVRKSQECLVNQTSIHAIGSNMEKDDPDEGLGDSEQQAITESSHKISEHAQQRRAEGRRVSPGYGDAQQAQPSHVFLQPNRRYIVRGPRGREHVFDTDGTHITSIDRSRQAHQRLIRLGKRSPVTLEQFRQFKELFT